MCLLQLFCLSFQNKLVAVGLCAATDICISFQRSCFPGCVPQTLDVLLWIYKFFHLPLCLSLNAQVCEQLLMGHEFLFHVPKPKNHTAALGGNLRPKALDTGGKFFWGDDPWFCQLLTFPLATLGFWISVGNTVFKQLPSCLSMYETSNRWSYSNHATDAPLLPSLFSCLSPLSLS